MSDDQSHEDSSLKDVVTLSEPLGPPQTETVFNMGLDIFSELYDQSNRIHREARTENPFFIIGRKGAGKTAFLIGAALAEEADVILIKSEDVYVEVGKLCARYRKDIGPVVADSLVHVWEVLLYHAAMLQIVRSRRLLNSPERERLWTYMSAFGDPEEIEVDSLLASVGAAMTEELLTAPQGISFREACWAINPGRGGFSEAVRWTRDVLAGDEPKPVYVVVDNLEDLHKKLDDFADVVTALFRVVNKGVSSKKQERIPFRIRFAFPAELLSRLRMLAANPEKEFRRRMIIRWTASELIALAGNRLRVFLDLYFPTAAEQLALPKQHKPGDRVAAEKTLRALLPGHITNGLGSREDPVAYLMRHTQLLPRHLIIILNEIMSNAATGISTKDIPKATAKQVVTGVDRAERVIVDGILATYSYEFPKIGDALDMVKNHIGMSESVSDLHKIFNRASVARVGLDFEEFLDASLAVGALGVVNAEFSDGDRYIQGEFSYTFAGEVRPVEARDDICVHPLFVSRLFDRHSIEAMVRNRERAVYPYGSDPEHDDHEV